MYNVKKTFCKKGMKIFSQKYDKTVVVEFYSDNLKKRKVIAKTAKDLLGAHFKEKNRLIYSSQYESYPDLSQLTAQSRLCLVGHGREGKFSGCDVDMLVERLIEDCSLKAVKRISFISCNLGKTRDFIEELQLKLAKEDIFTEIGAYKSYLIVDRSGHRWVDLEDRGGIVEAGKQKVVMGWEIGPDDLQPRQVVLTDTNEVNPDYGDILLLDCDDDEEEEESSSEIRDFSELPPKPEPVIDSESILAPPLKKIKLKLFDNVSTSEADDTIPLSSQSFPSLN